MLSVTFGTNAFISHKYSKNLPNQSVTLSPIVVLMEHSPWLCFHTIYFSKQH